MSETMTLADAAEDMADEVAGAALYEAALAEARAAVRAELLAGRL